MSILPPQYQLAAKCAGLGAIAVIGAGAWHWLPWVGPHARLAAKDDAIAAQAKAIDSLNLAVQARDQAIMLRDDQLRANGVTAANEAAQTADFFKGQASVAFKAGYASKRCVGPQPAPDPAGVRDLRALWREGAFTGSAAAGVPAKPAGVHPG